MNRGDRREAIFNDNADRERFLETLGEACQKTAWQVHAYCLMHNHFHVVVETPQPNLVAGMKWLMSTYTSRFNRRHKECGHLLRPRRWKDGELSRRRKGDPAKLTIAWRLRQETTMTLKWIAERLHMGRWTYLSNCLLEKRKQK